MFRRRKAETDTRDNNGNSHSGPIEPNYQPIADSGGAIWYKRPSGTSSGASSASMGSSDDRIDREARLQASAMVSSQQTYMPSTTYRQLYPNHQHHLPQQQDHSVDKYKGGGAIPANPPLVPTTSTPNRPNKKTISLLEILNRNDWNLALRRVEEDPKCARARESVSLHGLATVATPLHIAVCLGAPVSIKRSENLVEAGALTPS